MSTGLNRNFDWLTAALQRLITVTFIVGAMAAAAHIERAAAADSPGAFVQQLAGSALGVSSDAGRSHEAKVDELRKLLRQGFDVDYIGKYVLGRYWRRASEAEREAYLDIFEEYVVQTYAKRFASFDGGNLSIGRSDQFQEGVHRVQSTFTGSDGQPVRLDWFVHDTGDGFKAVDVVVQGVSLRKAQRDEFMSVIRNGGGTVAGLIDDLRKLVERMKTA
jgi:phospholipid transport system substrate-binding protein